MTIQSHHRSDGSRVRCAPDFPERDEARADRIAARADLPIYFTDHETAVRVRDGKVDVLSEGRWRFHP